MLTSDDNTAVRSRSIYSVQGLLNLRLVWTQVYYKWPPKTCMQKPSPPGPSVLLHHPFPVPRPRKPQSRGLPSQRVSHMGMTGLEHHWVTVLLSISGTALSSWRALMHHDMSYCYIKSYFVWNIEMLQPRTALLYLDITKNYYY